ncbi:MAG: response regulator [Verrucomicrobiales bacterium]|nr:response regulator [Verrucomicrobiales bacterium]
MQDITERRLLEEQLRQSQKMEAIGQLAGGVAHDFNNILAVIVMQVELLADTEGLSDEVRDAMDEIRTAAKRAADLTQQLLLFSRRQVMQPRVLDLNEVVTNVAKMLQRIIGEDVRMQISLHPQPLHTRADGGMLDQVLLNLAVNSRDAMPGGGQLRIATCERFLADEDARLLSGTSPGRYVCLHFADTGTGIAPEHLDRIFEPFYTTKEPGKGTGLGLATVFGIVKQHAGAITVESTVGVGTEFRVCLPAFAAEIEPSYERSATTAPRGGGQTILLVEDEASVRTLTRRVLVRAGYRVLEAPHGLAALEIGLQDPSEIDILFTDIVMPEGIGGRELAARLQERNSSLRVVFTSGYSADIAGREFSLKAGQIFLPKPAAIDDISEAVRKCLASPVTSSSS